MTHGPSQERPATWRNAAGAEVRKPVVLVAVAKVFRLEGRKRLNSDRPRHLWTHRVELCRNMNGTAGRVCDSSVARAR